MGGVVSSDTGNESGRSLVFDTYRGVGSESCNFERRELPGNRARYRGTAEAEREREREIGDSIPPHSC